VFLEVFLEVFLAARERLARSLGTRLYAVRTH
jgi:hypothetical protein